MTNPTQKPFSEGPGGPTPCRQILWAGQHAPPTEWVQLLRALGLEPVLVEPDRLKEEVYYRYPGGVIWASATEWRDQPGFFFPELMPVWTIDPAPKDRWLRHVGYEGPLPPTAGANEQLRIERGIRRYLHHRYAVDVDALTNLPNRPCFESWLQRAMHWNPNQPWHLGFIDVLGMSDTNRFQGYVAGDRKLRQFARILAAHLPADAPRCRWGGDEFLIAITRREWRHPADCRCALASLPGGPFDLQRLVDQLHDRLRSEQG